MANGLADPLRSIQIEIPADHRRTVAGAIYQAAANVAARAAKVPERQRRQREQLAREARELRELAQEVQP